MSNIPFFSKYYIKPWSRAPPYMLGLIFGILYREYNLEKNEEDYDKTTFFSSI